MNRHPQHLSIFGDTYHGVPNPVVPHKHPYPTRYHGPMWRQPQATFSYRQRPLAVAPFAGLGGCPCAGPGPCECPGLGVDGEPVPLFQSISGNRWLDAAIGALVGFVGAPTVGDRPRFAAAGAVASGLFGTVGLVGTLAVEVDAARRLASGATGVRR